MAHENQKSWQTATEKTVGDTRKALTGMRKILDQLQAKEIEETVQTNARDKLLNDAAAIDTVDARIIEVRESMKRIGDQFLVLQGEYRTKYASLKLCEERIEIRSQRPPEEIFNDHLHEALENEKKVLTEARTELQKLAKDAMKVQTDLEMIVNYLTKDVTHKRQPFQAPKKMMKAVSLPQLSLKPVANNLDSLTAGSTLVEDPVLKKMSAADLIKTALQRETREREVVKKGTEAIMRLNSLCAAAHAKVLASIEKRCAEVANLKKITYEHLQEANSTVEDANRVITRLIRAQKITLETAQAQGLPPPPPDPKRDEKLASAMALLKELTEARSNIEDDYRLKTGSLIFEMNCKNLVPSRVDSRTPAQRSKFRQPRSPLTSSAKLSLSPQASPKGAPEQAPSTPAAGADATDKAAKDKAAPAPPAPAADKAAADKAAADKAPPASPKADDKASPPAAADKTPAPDPTPAAAA